MEIISMMKIKSGFEKEYKKRHDELWAEMENGLLNYGVEEYQIYLNNKTGDLVSILKIKNLELWKLFPETEICKKWWEFMKDIMFVNKDNSPVSTELSKVFEIKQK